MKNKLIIGLLLATALVFTACQKSDEIIPQMGSQTLLGQINKDGQIILGKKLKNPYTVKNMRKAYKILKEKSNTLKKNYASKTLSDSLDIETTDYYVKFWIENDEQKSLLIADSLNLSIIPLDVEIEQEGDSFVDDNTEIEKGQWLYTSVVKNYQFHSEIKYEIIADLFLIEESDIAENDASSTTTIAGKSGISKSFLYDLEDEALKLTDNYTERKEKNNNGNIANRRKATPRGFVKVINTVTRVSDPVIGVKVKTRRWFKWAKGWTNSQGYYKVNRGYRRSVHYTVVFKNTRGFKIWSHLISMSSARYRAGKHSKYGYNFDFSKNSSGWSPATVNNATVKYLNYCTQFGIGLPPSNLRIVARTAGGSGATPMLRHTWGWVGFRTNSDLISFLGKASISVPANALWLVLRFVLPDVIIPANAVQGTDRIFGTTFHELAHASHFAKVGSGYWIKYINYIITYGAYGNGNGYNSGLVALGEAWGYHIGYFLSLQEFGDNSVITGYVYERFTPKARPFIPTRSVYEDWIPKGLMNDLIDTHRDYIRSGYYDDVTGYTNKNIYDALDSDVQSPQAFRDRLLKENNNKDGADVLNLFEAYYWN